MRSLILLAALSALVCLVSAQSSTVPQSSDPVANLSTTPEIVKYWGYPLETYNFTTQNGYILTIFRIPKGISPASENCAAREPVILHHGLLSSSADWVTQDASNSLPFILAENCYDVWLPNARGTSYSKLHETLNSTTDTDYWQFSVDEMGKYDVPAMIDFVLDHSGSGTPGGAKFTRLSWVGHSQGCAAFYVGLFYHPEYNAKVRKMVSLAPAANIQGIRSPAILALGQIPDPILELSVMATFKGAFFPQVATALMQEYAPGYCPQDPTGAMCSGFMNFLTGTDTSNNISSQTAGRVTRHTPDTVSVRQMTHLLQNYETCLFASQTNNLYNILPFLDETAVEQLFQAVPNADLILNPISDMFSGKRKRRSLVGNIVNLLEPSMTSTTTSTTGGPAAVTVTDPVCKPSIGHPRIVYDLKKVIVPTMMMYGPADALVSPQGVKQTYADIGTPTASKKLVEVPSYNHLDFMYTDTSKDMVYVPIYTFLSDGQPTSVV